MSRPRIAFHEISYEVAARVEARQPHMPTQMRSGCSTPPIKMYVCDMPKCGAVAYVYGNKSDVPICEGGMKWSFTTANMAFDPAIHKPWVSR